MRFMFCICLLFLILLALLPLPTSLANPPEQDETPILHIGDVQGVIGDDMETANTYKSDYNKERVQVSGVVTNLIMIDNSGRKVYGFFMQETSENSDGDPLTSDGIQVISGATATIGDYDLAVGDAITITAKVEEWYDFTRLRDVEFVSLDDHIDDLNAAIPAVELNPQGTPAEIYRYYERIEGMRVSVPAGSVVVAPTHYFSSSNDTETYVVRPDHPIALRANAYERRVYRDVHPLDDGVDAENLYRISVEGNILKAQADDYEVNLPIYNTFDVFTTELTGNIIYAYERYTLMIDSLPEVERENDPLANNALVAPDRNTQFSVATTNIENLYDYYNDPFDREDTPDDLNLNYVPLSLEQYQTHITKAARQVLYGMEAPDIVAYQEIEDQDVCTAGGNWYGTCVDDVDNADGQPDVLQDVAAEIARLSDGEIEYAAIIDRDSADDRGIAQAYLYRTDRVELVEPTADHPIFGERATDEGLERHPENGEISNPKALNERFGIGLDTFSRAPLVGYFRIHREAVGSADYVEVYVANNHFKSVPDENIVLREGQARYNLGLYESVASENPDVYYIVTGDLNAFSESSEMTMLNDVLVNTSEFVRDEADYTYIFAGQAQTLDYMFISPSLADQLASTHIVHISADYSYQYESDAESLYRAGDHDPIVSTFNFPE